ncbi:MAG: Mobile element protein [bacterium]|nr:Mobile element protein [bacterium]
MRFRCIEAEKANYPVGMMCRVLKVSRSGFYAWRQRPESRRRIRDRALTVRIRAVHAQSRRTYGSPRITAELRDAGEAVARKRVARLMREEGLYGRRPRRFVRTTNSAHSSPVAANVLARRFAVGETKRVWVGDITYLATAQGWVYLAVLLDLASRAVVGWAVSDKIDVSVAAAALDMALQRSEPPDLHHTDRGIQYACDAYQRELEKHKIAGSMSRKGNCWDNAVAESFFSTLKTECVEHRVYASLADARAALFDYIESFYNRRRRHSSLGYRSPADYEREILKAA